ncbi:hypothetical protein [Actinomadura sp. 9N215]|uniref:hypothetical protein n=1 Tax=Actinomadura sp. 9N215 TaxID=3375150 RepID=UPI00379A70A2
MLREIVLYDVTAPDLGPVSGLPLESVQPAVNGPVHLEALSAHPTLRALKLASTSLVDLGPLLTVPHLHGLDLSEAQAPDLSVLADLSQLRYLAWRPDQWTSLGHHALPASLAGACLAGEPSLTAALAWASTLGIDTTGVWRHSGWLEPAPEAPR